MKKRTTLLLALILTLSMLIPSVSIFACESNYYSNENPNNSDPMIIPNFVYHHLTYGMEEPYIYVRTGYANYTSIYHGWLAYDMVRSLSVGHSVYVGTLYRIDYNNGTIPGPTKKVPEYMVFGSEFVK